MNKHLINRRTLFRGATLGTAGVYLAPFLRDLDAASGGVKPARVVFFLQANGLYPAEIQPKGINREKSTSTLEDMPLTNGELGSSLEPLAPWQKKMTLIQGLSGKVARGSHGLGFAALGCWPMKKKAYGETINAAMARNLPGIYKHIGLGTSEKGRSIAYNVTSEARGKALPTILDPMLAHKQFFAAGSSGSARAAFDVDTDLFDFMADDIKTLQSRLDGSEKTKLDRYLEAFHSMHGRQEKLAAMSEQIRKATPVLDPQKLKPATAKTGPSGIFDRIEAHFDIAAGSLIAGLTNVVTISANSGPDRVGISCAMSEVGKGSGYIAGHAIGHGASQNGLSSYQCHSLIRRKLMEKLAKFITTLESIPEGDGTMMDNTLIIYTSDAADSHHPGCKEWPYILIGDLGGRLKLGNRYLNYPTYGNKGHRTFANLYMSLLHAVGEHRNTFGIKDTGLADLNQDGPLTEILV